MTSNNSLIKPSDASTSTEQRDAHRYDISRYLPRTVLCLLLPLLQVLPATAQQAKKSDQNEKPAPEASLQPAATSYKADKQRDPFFHPEEKPVENKISVTSADDVELSRGAPPPGIAGTFISNAGLEGIVIRNDRGTAVFRGNDQKAYFMHEGDRLFDGYIKTIYPDFVVLIRETKMRSGKTITQEVTKRLRKP